MNSTYKETIYRVSNYTMFGNLLLFIFKFLAGLYGHSHAMISDAVHSLSDIISTVIVMIGAHFSSMKADNEHPYGHERMECIAAMILSILLVFTGLEIGYKSILSLINFHILAKPHWIAFLASVISIITKEGMYWYTIYYAKKINSPSLKADAYHHRSDAYSSIGSLIGITGAMMGYPFLDPLAGLCICLFILKPGITIFYDATMKMVDHSCSEEIQQELYQFLLNNFPYVHIDSLKTRMFSEKYYIDLEIAVDGNMTLKDAHAIADNIHNTLENHFTDIKHCMIHVNPRDSTTTS